MKALVTGAAGFIGSHVVDRMLADGWDVVGIDNFDPYYAPSQKRRNLSFARRSEKFRLVEGDICWGDDLARTLVGGPPDVIVHLAAKAGVRASQKDPAAYLAVNLEGTLNLLNLCRDHDLPLVMASTSSVYGMGAKTPFTEEQDADRPLSPYAATKRSAELMAYTYHHLYGFPVAMLRLFTVYGPRGRPDMAVAGFTRAMREGRTIRLHGEETARDFTYVDDIVDGFLGAIRWAGDRSGQVGCEAFNLGRSEPMRVRLLIEELGRLLGREPKVELGELELTESPSTAADVSRAAAMFGYAPKVSLEEGLSLWVDWYTQSEESPLAHGESS